MSDALTPISIHIVFTVAAVAVAVAAAVAAAGAAAGAAAAGAAAGAAISTNGNFFLEEIFHCFCFLRHFFQAGQRQWCQFLQ